jgi:sortase A
LKVDRLGIDQIVLAGATGRTLAFGPGLLDGTKKPGETGISVISAHRDTHFRFLKDLIKGDMLEVQSSNGKVHRYLVKQTMIVDSAKAVLPDSGTESLIALATCYPFDAVVPGGPLRYVVIAEDSKNRIITAQARIQLIFWMPDRFRHDYKGLSFRRRLGT